MLAACGGGGVSTPIAGTTEPGSTSTSQFGNNNPNQPPSVVGGVSTTDPSSFGGNTGNTAFPFVPADATQARFNNPFGIARDAAGNLYIADAGNNTIRKIRPTGHVSTLAGSPGASGSTDGVGAAARFTFLGGITVDHANNIYVMDNGTVRRVTLAGVVTTIAGAPGAVGDADGPSAVARFNRPLGGIATDPAGNVYVADTGNYLIRRVTPAGEVSTYAGTRGSRGTANGSTASATFLGPRGIASDFAGNLYVTDWFGPPAPNIPEGSTFIRRIGINGSVSTIAGSYGSEIAPPVFRDVHAITADNVGNAYVITATDIVRVTPAGTLSTVAAVSGQDLTIDGRSNLYVTGNHAITKVAQDGTVSLVAGQPGQPGSTDVP